MIAGPYCRIGADLTSLEGCDGGLNFSGFARVLGIGFGIGLEVEACRKYAIGRGRWTGFVATKSR